MQLLKSHCTGHHSFQLTSCRSLTLKLLPGLFLSRVQLCTLCEHKAKSGTSHFTVIRHGSNFNWSLLLYCTRLIFLLMLSTCIKFSIISDSSRKDTLTVLCLHWGRWTLSASVLSLCQNFPAFVSPLISSLELRRTDSSSPGHLASTQCPAFHPRARHSHLTWVN